MANILEKIVEKGHFKFVDEVPSWQEGVRLSTEPLIKTGYVTENYYQQIVDCIEKYGPYVVFEHEVAMPHTTENADGVLNTGVSFMRIKKPVSFGCDEDGNDKSARLFFTLAAQNPEEHMSNIQSLIGVFTNEPLLDALIEAESGQDILDALAANPCTEF
ncbi:MAG: PTS sugar transporter subunit IIA [Ileibacterium sp.]|nr:PTS sugar transporter subunit IIA [Ileibacterium sp.]